VTAATLQQTPGLAEHLAAELAAPQIVAQGSNEVRAILDRAAPDWQVWYPSVVEHINNNNLLPEGSDVNTMAATIVDLTNRFRSQEHAKIMAQSAVGAGTRPEPVGAAEAEWKAIHDAGVNTYADRRARGEGG
jgi:hypothetical protein